MMRLGEVQQEILAKSAQAFSAEHPGEDVVLLEPYTRAREQGAAGPLDADGRIHFVPRLPGKPIPIGRDARSQILLDHPAVSRLHLVIAHAGAGWKVMDRSSNGSWMAGQRLPANQAVDLPYEQPVRLGKALILRVFAPDGFHRAVAGVGLGTGGAPAPGRVPDRRAETVQLHALEKATARQQAGGAPPAAAPAPAWTPPPAAPVAPRGRDDLDFDFDGGDDAPPPVAPPSPPPASGGGRGDVEFDFDFDTDGRGGFA